MKKINSCLLIFKDRGLNFKIDKFSLLVLEYARRITMRKFEAVIAAAEVYQDVNALDSLHRQHFFTIHENQTQAQQILKGLEYF